MRSAVAEPEIEFTMMVRQIQQLYEERLTADAREWIESNSTLAGVNPLRLAFARHLAATFWLSEFVLK